MTKLTKFLVAGALWGLLSSPLLLSDVVREYFYQKLGHGIELLVLISPIAWATLFTNNRVIGATLTIPLGGIFGLLIYVLYEASQIPPKT